MWKYTHIAQKIEDEFTDIWPWMPFRALHSSHALWTLKKKIQSVNIISLNSKNLNDQVR